MAQLQELERMLDGDVGASGCEDACETRGVACSEGEPLASAPTLWRRALLAGLLGVALLAVVAVTPIVSVPSPTSSTTVRKLLESRELADVVTDNLLRVDGRARNRDALHARVVDYARRDAQLDTALSVSGPEAAAIMHSMRLLGDPRVAKVNSAIVEAVRDTALASSNDREELKRRIVEKLQPHHADMRALSVEVLPDALRGESRGRRQDVLEVNPEKMHLLKEFDARMVSGPTAAVSDSALRHSRVDTSAGAIADQFSVFAALASRAHAGSNFATPESRRLAAPAANSVATNAGPKWPYYNGGSGGATTPAPDPYEFDCNPLKEDCRSYSSAFDCIWGEVERASPETTAECAWMGVGNSFEALTTMFD